MAVVPPPLMMVAKAVAVTPVLTDRLDGKTAAASGPATGGKGAKVAVTDVADERPKTAQLYPLHAPPQPVKLQPLFGFAVSSTDRPTEMLLPQIVVQSTPGDAPMTVPWPSTLTSRFFAGCARRPILSR